MQSRPFYRWATLVAPVLFAAAGCTANTATAPEPSEIDPPPVETRPFLLGFTDFPHAVNIQALVDAYRVIEDEADLVVEHFDGGVPWNEALNGDPYPAGFQAELAAKATLLPDGHSVYLAVTPIAFGRNGLALYQGDEPGQPLPPPWDDRPFDHPDVIMAFGNHVERMIEIFQPDFVAFAIEANMLIASVPEQWEAFVRLAGAVHGRLTAAHPTMPIFVSLQAETFHADEATQTTELAQLMPFTDFIAVSAYPYFTLPTVDAVSAAYFADLRALGPGKPFAISETGWPAEDVTAPSPVTVSATPADQLRYLTWVLDDAEAAEAAFVTWFFTRDFDEAWDAVFSQRADAPVVRLFRDTGIYDGAGVSRPSRDRWLEWLARSF